MITNNRQIRIYVNKTENMIAFKIKTENDSEFLTHDMMKLLGSTKSRVTKDENGENVPHLEIAEVVLVYFNVASNDYQHKSKVFYTFASNKSFGQLLIIIPEKLIFFKTYNSEFSYIELRFYQNSKLTDIKIK